MQRWEHLSIGINEQSWWDSLGRKGKLADRANPTAVLDALGDEGWELTGVAAGDQARYRLFLKRPKP